MNNSLGYDVLQDRVRTSVARVPGRPAESLDPTATLVRDLGANSLGLVELRCVLPEERLGTVTPRRSVLDHLVEATGTSEAAYDSDGGVTGLAVRALRGSAFRYEEEQARTGMRPYEVARGTTVANWTHFAHTLFDHLPASCPECAGTEAVVSPARRAQCAGCAAPLAAEQGDAVLASTVRVAAESAAVRAGDAGA